jgi:hypothetical protein
MSIVREEIFGPVMSVLDFEDEEEVIARAKRLGIDRTDSIDAACSSPFNGKRMRCFARSLPSVWATKPFTGSA